MPPSAPAGAARRAAAHRQPARHGGGPAPAAGQPAAGVRVAAQQGAPAGLLPGAVALHCACAVAWSRAGAAAAVLLEVEMPLLPMPICRRVARLRWSWRGSSRPPGSRCAASSPFQLHCCRSSWLESRPRAPAAAARGTVRQSLSPTAAWTKVRVATPACLGFLLLSATYAGHLLLTVRRIPHCAVVSRASVDQTAEVLRSVHGMGVTVHSVPGKAHSMPQGPAEMQQLMQFWAQHLSRRPTAAGGLAGGQEGGSRECAAGAALHPGRARGAARHGRMRYSTSESL